jgi:hypothetical protein
MRQRLGSHLTYANVMATLAVFIALGGGAYAAFHLPKNSVRSRNIVNGQVKAHDLAAPPPLTRVALGISNGVSCRPSNSWATLQSNLFGQVGYYRDITGRVHLGGDALRCGNPPSGDTIFTLPLGYRPQVIVFGPVALFGGTAGALRVTPAGAVSAVSSTNGQIWNLNAISFQCGPPGHNGCP